MQHLSISNRLLTGLAVALALIVFLKNAWVAEDAFIVFRSLDQLAAGHGPIWNPHERVQVFTSPLWFWLQAALRRLSSQVYFNVIALSLALWMATVWIFKNHFRQAAWKLLFLVFLLTASVAFFDYTSSGLENSLAYFLIAILLRGYAGLFFTAPHPVPQAQAAHTQTSQTHHIRAVLIAAGLLLVTRHDLLLLILPLVAQVVYRRWRCFSARQWLGLGAMTLLPLAAWTLFSLLYYGFPFPNTAYAKLSTGIEKSALVSQGFRYFYASLRFDAITLMVIGAFLVLSLSNRLGLHARPVAYGVMANLAYVVYVGGDFMQGRFLSYAYLVSAVVLLTQAPSAWSRRSIRAQSRSVTHPIAIAQAAAVALALYLCFYPNTPLRSPLKVAQPTVEDIMFLGVAHERAFFAHDLSLWSYASFAQRSAEAAPQSVAQAWRNMGLELQVSPDSIRTASNIGLYGYWSGIEPILLDISALSDPLLARLPVLPPPPGETRQLRPGHYPRPVPEGYVETVRTGQNSIQDPELRQLYQDLKLITQSSELFSAQRLRAIAKLNF